MRVLFLCLALTSGCAITLAQANHPNDPLKRFKQQGASAVTAEKAREKQSPCHTAQDSIACTSDELDRTNKNYLQIARAVGGLLRLYNSDNDAGREINIGGDFDTAESAWAKYKDAQCNTVVADEFPETDNNASHGQFEAMTSCKLAVTRRHIYELNAVYGWLWTSK